MATKALQTKILEWLANGETGNSSQTIAFTVLGIKFNHANHPYDPADFRRCMELLDAVPELRERKHMKKVAALSDEWKGLVARWDEIEALLREELAEKTGRGPRTYEVIKSIIYAKGLK